jgi:hypothetical protein
MLVIREEQMVALRAAADGALCERLYAHMRTAHPDAVAQYGEPAARAHVVRCVAEARSVGLTWELCIADFVSLAFTVAPYFYAHPAVAAALREIAAAPNPDADFFLLGQRVPGAAWDEARLHAHAR